MAQSKRDLSALAPRKEDLEPIEIASRDEIEALQLRQLKWSIRHAYENVPHYRRSLDAAGLHPEDLRALADLRKFPFTTKADLRANYPFGMFAVPRERIARLHASSGTTGKPTVVGYTAGDIAIWSDLMARSIRAGGGRPGMRVHVAYGYGLFTGGLGAHYGAERLGCAVIPVSGGMTERQVQLILDFEPEIIMVTPSYMLAILDAFRAQGADPRLCSLRFGMFGAEPWTNAMRGEIEDAFDMHAVDLYGLSEVMGPGVANECVETKDGLHIWEDHFLPEIVDPASGEALPDGTVGELVFTSLTKEAMPVIRYRTRDLTRLLPGTARSMRRMERIAGRSDDMIILRGVNVFPTQIEELILRDPRLAPHFLIELRREGRLDAMTVRVEARADAAEEKTRAAASRDLAHHIKSTIGISATIETVAPGAIERSLGKAKRIVDLRPKG
ncbi:MAG TPA: phenylacetate--CoA ligase PaaK [Stellaceae bacterium]|nr:phenylacetate--CoA ligase PaaK [Stellaceae bacterium]